MLTPAKRAHLYRQIKWDELDPLWLRRLIEWARNEDLTGEGFRTRPQRAGDATTALMPQGHSGKCALVARHVLVPCGLPLLPRILEVYGSGCSVELCVADGERLEKGDTLAVLEGPVSTLLQAERVLLNFIQKLSGVATATRQFVDAMDGSPTKLLDTRKTTPLFRALEKYAFSTGGGWNHRLGLYDRIMLKDNHLAAAGAVEGSALTDAVKRAVAARPDLVVEVEVDAIEQILPVLEAGADVILLDNFTPQQAGAAVELIGMRALTEASGGISLATLSQFAHLGLDFISTGAPVHHSVWCDIGLDWV